MDNKCPFYHKLQVAPDILEKNISLVRCLSDKSVYYFAGLRNKYSNKKPAAACVMAYAYVST